MSVDDKVLNIFASRQAAEDWLDGVPGGGQTRRQLVKELLGADMTIREWTGHVRVALVIVTQRGASPDARLLPRAHAHINRVRVALRQAIRQHEQECTLPTCSLLARWYRVLAMSAPERKDRP